MNDFAFSPSATVFRETLDDHDRIELRVESEGGKPVLRLALPRDTRSGFLPRLLAQLSVYADGEAVDLRARGAVHAEATLAHSPQRLEVRVNGQPMREAILKDGQWQSRAIAMPITSTECRQLGEFPNFTLYPRDRPPLPSDVVVSDFHTHSSALLSGHDFLELAIERDIAYPVRLLKTLGMKERDLPAERRTVDRVVFPPLIEEEKDLPGQEPAVPLKLLTKLQLDMLARAMDAPYDRQSSFGTMERVFYRYRYPLSKEKTLVEANFLRAGENYVAQGIRYAEVTTTRLEQPDILEATHHVAGPLHERGLDMRYLVGVPRTYDKAQLHTLFEHIKTLAESPYVAGLDIIGYETNKTSDLRRDLENMAKWCKRHGHEEFTFRVHAGENAKNHDNVYDVLDIANRYGIRVRIGHALYGLDERTLELAQRLARRGLCVFEFNPPSNIALNNIDGLESIPMRACLDRGIPFVVAGDGNGIMTSNPAELRFLLQAAGLTEEDIATIRRTEKELIARQLRYSEVKRNRVLEAFDRTVTGDDARDAAVFTEIMPEFLSGLKAEMKVTPSPATAVETAPLPAQIDQAIRVGEGVIPEALAKKRPILLVGASGSSWERAGADGRREAAIAIDMLARALDPAKVYFVHGRSKKAGIAGQLAESLQRLKQKTGQSFDVLSLITESHLREKLEESESLAPHVTHLEPIRGNLLQVAETLADLAHDRHGVMIAAGGAAFTRDAILEANHRGVSLQLMGFLDGASKDKAQVMDPVLNAVDAQTLVRHVMREHRELFRPELHVAEKLDDGTIEGLLKTLYDRSTSDVGATTSLRGRSGGWASWCGLSPVQGPFR